MSSETCVKDGLDLVNRARGGGGPPRERRDITAGSSITDPVDEDTEESGRHFVRVWLELRLDVDDECGGYGGEQTSLDVESVHLYVSNVRKFTYKDQGGAQVFVVFLDESSVFCFPAVHLVELGLVILLS